MGDPLYRDDRGRERLFADPRVRPARLSVHWLKIASGLVALEIIAAIWMVWRWQGGSRA
jgi:hypothetical protein